MIDMHNCSDAEYIAQMKAAWGTQLDPYILTLRGLEKRLQRVYEDLAYNKELYLRAENEKESIRETVLALMQEPIAWREDRQRLHSSLKFWEGEANKHLVAFTQVKRYADELELALKGTLATTPFGAPPPKARPDHTEAAPQTVAHNALKEILEGHAEALRKSVSGFPPCVQELKVKEQLGFFEPLLGTCDGYTAGFDECPKTS